VQNALSRITLNPSIEVKTDLEPDLPIIIADPIQMTRVMVNLCKNAVQAMPEGGNLQITTLTNESGWIIIEITDNGIGISPENMKHLFEPLFTTKAKGVGLGLAVVKTFVEAHDGSVFVESRLDEGTTFSVTLPIMPVEVV
jgi:signal transduction histidine kinase